MTEHLIAPGISLASVVLHLRCQASDMRRRSLGHAAAYALLNAPISLDGKPGEPRIFGDLIGDPGEKTAGKPEIRKGLKPYTASGLYEAGPRGPVEAREFHAGETYFMRFTVLTAALASGLDSALSIDAAEAQRCTDEYNRAAGLDSDHSITGFKPGSILNLDKIPFQVEALSVHSSQHPLAGQTDYGALYSSVAFPAWGGRPENERKVTLQFISPTFFSLSSPAALQEEELFLIVPYPEQVFGSLAERWNLFAPIHLPDDIRDIFASQVVFSRYELRSAATTYKGGSIKIGALGMATYEAPHAGRDVQALLNLLADFSLYAGAGAMTTQGFGQLWRIDDR